MNGGYILVDAAGLDLSDSTSQTVTGLYAKLIAAMKTGKPILVHNVDADGSGAIATPIPVYAYMDSTSVVIAFGVIQVTVTTASACTVVDLTDTSSSDGSTT